MASDEKDIERMPPPQKSKIDARVVAEGEKLIEKENENAEFKDDFEMRADPRLLTSPLAYTAHQDQARIYVMRLRPHRNHRRNR